MKTNFNKKAKALLSALGYVTEITEHYNYYSGRKNDFCGFADAISLNPAVEKNRILAVQITSLKNISTRFNKITMPTVKDSKTNMEMPNPVPDKAKRWLQSGGGLWIIGFDSTVKGKGKIREIYLDSNNNFSFQDNNIGD